MQSKQAQASVIFVIRWVLYLFEFAIVLLMSDQSCPLGSNNPPKNPKKGEHRDNCQNCIRERKQNQSFIKIYQRLQQVQKKTFRISRAVQDHKISSDTNRSFYKSLEQKMVSLPKVKKEVNRQALENVGFDLAAGIIEKESKSRMVEENQRLKLLLNQMRTEKWERKMEAKMNSSCFVERDDPSRHQGELDRTFNSCQTDLRGPSLSQTHNLQNLLLSHDQQLGKSKENTTQSSTFSTAPLRRSVDLSKYNDMNLWLYQNQKNTQLQEELYRTNLTNQKQYQSQPKKIVNNARKLMRGLPALKVKK